MSRKKIISLTFFLLIILGSASWLHRQSRLRRDQRQRDGLLASLGRRPSGVWYCGPIQFGVEIEFSPSVPGVLFEATPSDTVGAVHSYEWLAPPQGWPQIKEAMPVILPAVSSVLGTSLGFYFGSQKR
jgi:hypothetical protein